MQLAPCETEDVLLIYLSSYTHERCVCLSPTSFAHCQFPFHISHMHHSLCRCRSIIITCRRLKNLQSNKNIKTQAASLADQGNLEARIWPMTSARSLHCLTRKPSFLSHSQFNGPLQPTLGETELEGQCTCHQCTCKMGVMVPTCSKLSRYNSSRC